MAHAIQAPPPTLIEPVTEVLHGVEITDPYRWLEDQNSPQTREWLEDQAAYTRAYFDSIPDRERIKVRVKELIVAKDVTSEIWNVGDRNFFLKRCRDGEQPCIVLRDGLFGPEIVLVDPAQRGSGNSTLVSIVAISHDGRFLAYSVRQGGTDNSSIEILDVERLAVLPDSLPEGFCTAFAFAQDGTGFYYSHRELHDSRPNYRAALWHKFGTERSQDQEEFFVGEDPNLFLSMIHSFEAKLLAYCVFAVGKNPATSIYLRKLEPGAVPRLFLHDIKGCFVPFFVGGELLAYTDVDAPNFRIARIDQTDPRPASWRDIVAESDRRIQQFAVAGDQIFVTRVDRFSTKVEAFRLSGGQGEDISFPRNGTIGLLNRTNPIDTLFCSYTSICKAPTVYCFSPRDKHVRIWEEPSVPFDPSLISVEEVAYPSKDGTLVPLFLAARKDLLRSGPLPTFLTGYGGFGICVTPRFTVYATFLIEQGFLFAVPAQRGGSELGSKWHEAGKRANRQNSFDDFITAAEWLQLQGRADRRRTAIGGASNAGLLVGVAITQRPDLFRAAICLGPLLDMARYHLFNSAVGWSDEYGSPDDEPDFRSLLTYSPYHRVQDGTEYPAVLIISGDADARCNPLHARKMTARMQAANCSDHPIMLDYKANWGHTPAQPQSIKIEALTDRLSFLCNELGVQLSS
jgi:prolyl oligopeptidase